MVKSRRMTLRQFLSAMALLPMPAASVSGFYLGHPDSTYFNVGKIGHDQLQDQAVRRKASESELERLLAPNL